MSPAPRPAGLLGDLAGPDLVPTKGEELAVTAVAGALAEISTFRFPGGPRVGGWGTP